MILFLIAVAIWVSTGISALVFSRRYAVSSWIGAGGAILGCLLALHSALQAILGNLLQSFQFPWSLPFGSFYLKMDPLSGWFLLPILGLSIMAALFGTEYMAAWRDRPSAGGSWFFFNILIASMSLVVVARDGVLFLLAWEIMSLSSFFLVTFEHQKKFVRDAGWNYLVATHAGTACLLALFVLMAKSTGSFSFDAWLEKGVSPFSSIVLFLLAVVGFGTKAGFVPLHIWLPEAHPAAPSHVSALMSGVMIKTGIYGLVRLLSFSEVPPEWGCWILIGIGASSGILGVLFALAQHDLKRLLAYHSIENIGIISLGLGVGYLGLSIHSPGLAILGFSGGLLHVLNHALFKGLLFMGAGSLLHGTGTLDIEHLGGVIKKMPWTGSTFLIGAAAIAGLPPMNGFISEFLIYLGALKGIGTLHGSPLVFLIIAATSLTLIGGLALACFAKAFGVIFLGSPRSKHGHDAHESGWGMRLPMISLAAGCAAVGLMAPLAFLILRPVLTMVCRIEALAAQEIFTQTSMTLFFVVLTVLGFLGLAGFLWGLRRWLLSGKTIHESVTWDCGYDAPSPRMQYTGSSFAQPLTSLFKSILRTQRKISPPSGFFPIHASFFTSAPDVFVRTIIRPFYHAVRFGFSKMKWFQHGRVNAYILYIGLTLLILLIWNLR